MEVVGWGRWRDRERRWRDRGWRRLAKGVVGWTGEVAGWRWRCAGRILQWGWSNLREEDGRVNNRSERVRWVERKKVFFLGCIFPSCLDSLPVSFAIRASIHQFIHHPTVDEC